MNEPYLEIMKKGVPYWNQWRSEHPDVVPDLRACDWSWDSGTSLWLAGADFHNAQLQDADFSYRYLKDVNLDHANCEGAHFINVNFSNAHLQGANLAGADLSRANLWRANLEGANLHQSKLIGASLVETTLTKAHLEGSSVYAASVWNVVSDASTDESNLVISPPDQPIITVDNLKMAQFLYMILDNKEVREVLDSITSKVVLILGRFTPERKRVLDALREELRKRNYVPVVFDFDKPTSQNLTETVVTLAHMARFVIADITDAKSIPQELMAFVPTLPSVPVQPLLLASQDEYGMFESFKPYYWVLKPFRYDSLEGLLAALSESVIRPAERAKVHTAG